MTFKAFLLYIAIYFIGAFAVWLLYEVARSI